MDFITPGSAAPGDFSGKTPSHWPWGAGGNNGRTIVFLQTDANPETRPEPLTPVGDQHRQHLPIRDAASQPEHLRQKRAGLSLPRALREGSGLGSTGPLQASRNWGPLIQKKVSHYQIFTQRLREVA